MNRNNEAHFNQIPQTHISRSRFKRDQNVKFTLDAGRLVPFYVDEVLPGDTFSVDTTGIVRMTTPIFPVMDNAYLDIYYFYVPNRIVWEHWKEFCGENTTKAWKQDVEYHVPELKLTNYYATDAHSLAQGDKTEPGENTVLDYMGVPTKFLATTSSPKGINALPIRGYGMIWNEWFRDQNVDDPIEIPKGDTDSYGNVLTDLNTYLRYDDESAVTRNELNQVGVRGGNLLSVNKFHDYFTSCLPEPQKGPEVSVNLTGVAPVKAFTDYNMYIGARSKTGYFSSTATALAYNAKAEYDTDSRVKLYLSNNTTGSQTTTGEWLGANLANTSAITINDLRTAIATQHYYEAMARGGSRYREILQSMFDTTISDKTVQIPEYLGGGRYMINVSQVVQTSSTTEDSPQGNAGAISVTPFSENSFTKSFEEHGFVIGVCCIRHDRTYQQGLERMWSRKDTLDYYYPQFANIGEQPVKLKELWVDGNNSTEDDTFGYQEAWAEYRMKPNRVAGKFRSNATGTLDSWHYADYYEERPYLSDEWMKEGKEEIQRTLAVQNEPQFIADFVIANKTTRPMPLYSVPGLEKL